MVTVVEGSRGRVILALLALEIGVVVAMGIAGQWSGQQPNRVRASNSTLVERLRLTDLALWSGTSYCRHPSQADLFAPHGDHPSALDHFPAGSVVPPPPLAPGQAAQDVSAHNLEVEQP